MKHSIVTLVATIVGGMNLLFVYTFTLNKTELGFFKYFLSAAQLIYPFILFGFSSLSIKYFPDFKNFSNKKNGFLLFILIIPLLFFLIALISFHGFQEIIFDLFKDHKNKRLILKFFPFLPILVFALMYNALLSAYISNYKRIVVPEILNNLWLKIIIPILSLFYFFETITFDYFIYGLIGSYLAVTFGLLIYLKNLGKLDLTPNLKNFKKPILKDMSMYATFSALSITGHLVATQIDTFMVGSLMDNDNVAVYTIALYIATLVGIPFKSINTIVSPIISDSFNRKDYANISKLYSKTSLNLLIIGVFLFTGIWTSVDLLFEIIPNGENYIEGKYIILLLGIAKILDMTSGINYYIIAFSNFFRFNLYFGLILSVVNIGFNVFFINKYGLIGAALATLVSMFIFNLLKFLFILWKFKFHPFNFQMLLVILLGFLAFFVAFNIPKAGNPYIDIFINSIIVLIIYVPSILYFNLSDDLTLFKQQLLSKIGIR